MGDSTELFGDDGNAKGDVRHPLPASQRDNTAGETPHLSCGGGRGKEGSCGEVVVVKTTSTAGSAAAEPATELLLLEGYYTHELVGCLNLEGSQLLVR